MLALVVYLVHYAPLCRMLFARCTNHCVIMVMTLAGIWSELYCVILKVCLYLLYNYRETFSSQANQAVVTKLVENALSLLPNSTAATLKGIYMHVSVCDVCIHLHSTFSSFAEAGRTYYNSAAGTERLKTSGKYVAKCVQQRRRNRLKRVYILLYMHIQPRST